MTSMRKSCSTAKYSLTLQWDIKGIVYYELLADNKIITSDDYCQYLNHLKATLIKTATLAGRKGIT